jgi:hypothetical protein
MHDGNQDRLMVGQMAYFRCKWSRLPTAYQAFLDQHLHPGAPVVLLRGCLRWPVSRVSERHVFQNGAYGGLQPADYQSRPHAPTTDGDDSEAEWGTTAGFERSVRQWASTNGHPVVEITATDPQELADRAADVFLAWRRGGGVPRPRLVIDQFILSQPWHVLRAGAVPYWTVFPVQHCADAAANWINRNEPFPRIDVALFNHGVASDGLADIHRWQTLSSAGHHAGTVLGQRHNRFPTDFASLTRTTSALRRLPDGPPWATMPISVLSGMQGDHGRISRQHG